MTARRIILLGSTGSIGTRTLQVVDHLRSIGQTIEVVGLAAGSNRTLLGEQARIYGVQTVALAKGEASSSCVGDARVFSGDDSARALVEAVAQKGDLLVAAIVGAAGVAAVLEGIARGCDIALANKETLVAAGALVMPAVEAAGVRMLPIDSEHSALFQCLAARGDIDAVERVVLTASGGPFLGQPADVIAAATPEAALAHPTWSMGQKISIDSATLVNKALEVIEAHWLFGFGVNQIEAIVHPQSIVHGFVEFKDGSVLSQMGPPDMKTPIQVALSWPQTFEGVGSKMDWSTLSGLHFEPVDHETFPSIGMAYDVIEAGGTAGAIFNAANEAAVEAFLAGRIRFGAIWDCIEEAVESLPATPVVSLTDVLGADASAREVVARRVETLTANCS